MKTNVVQPLNIFLNLEEGIEERYSIKQAIVVDAEEGTSNHTIRHAIDSIAAHYLETRLRPKDLVGVSSQSSTIRAMVDKVHTQNLGASDVVQLLGDVGPNGNVQATILTQTLAQHLNYEAWLLPSQSVEGSVEKENRLVVSKDVTDVISHFDNIDIAIAGVEILEPSQSLKTSGSYYHEDMLQVLAGRGAVEDICLRYYDNRDQPVLQGDKDPVIGMALDKVKKCPNVVALVGGTDKVTAIRGALNGGYINVLITDYPTVRTLAIS